MQPYIIKSKKGLTKLHKAHLSTRNRSVMPRVTMPYYLFVGGDIQQEKTPKITMPKVTLPLCVNLLENWQVKNLVAIWHKRNKPKISTCSNYSHNHSQHQFFTWKTPLVWGVKTMGPNQSKLSLYQIMGTPQMSSLDPTKGT